MTAQAAYLNLPADDRFEVRLPHSLKRDAETIARANGQRLAQYILSLVAERVAEDVASGIQWRLSPFEQAELLRVLALPAPASPVLDAATERAAQIFGVDALH